MSAAPANCPRCGTLLPANAPEGLCPRCLGALNFATETVLAGEEKVAAQTPLTPEQLAVHFPQLEIIECLGRGGMGVVYKARQKSLNRLVALKLLAPERVQDAKFAERFTHEAQALAKLSHPNIVTIHDFGEAGGFYFLLMEFVDGVNLRQLLRSRKLTPEEALAIVPPLCDALQYAHERGIVHRDIKPENLLLDKDGRVKIADFGIAKMLGAPVGERSAEHCSAGEDVSGVRAEQSPALHDATAASTAGTPGYMAPEQSSAPQKVDARADIYSLGVVFYEMLTGELPGAKLQPPSRKVQIDVRLDQIVLRALEQTPELRYQTAGEFRTQIETLASSSERRSPNRPDPAGSETGTPGRILKTSNGLLTTPEEMGTFRGQMFAHRNRGQLVLDDRQLTFSRGGEHTVIPLAAIRDVSIGEYPRAMNPAGIDVLSVAYELEGQQKRVLLSPMEGWFALPTTWNARVAEWAEAIRRAAQAATGKAPGSTPREQLAMPSSAFGVITLMLAPLLAMGGFFLWTLLRQGTGEPMTLVRWAPFLFVVAVFLMTWIFPLTVSNWLRRRRAGGGSAGPAARTAASLLLASAALLGFGRVFQADHQRVTRYAAAVQERQMFELKQLAAVSELSRATTNYERVIQFSPLASPEAVAARDSQTRAAQTLAQHELAVKMSRDRAAATSKLQSGEFFRAILPCAPLFLFGLLLGSGRRKADGGAAVPGRPWMKWTGVAVLLIALPISGFGLWAMAQVLQDSSWNPGLGEATFTIGLWILSLLLPVVGSVLIGRSSPKGGPHQMSRGIVAVTSIAAVVMALLAALFADRGPFSLPTASEAIKRVEFVPVGVTSEKIVEVDIVTEVEQWSAEVRAGLVGPQLAPAEETLLRDEVLPTYARTLIKPSPYTGNAAWKLHSAGRGAWRVGFALPTPELAQQAFRSLQPFGYFTNSAGAGFATKLFTVRGPTGAVYRAEIQVTPPIHSANPEWVTMNGGSSDSGDSWTGTWTVQASQPGSLRVRRGTNIGHASLGRIKPSGPIPGGNKEWDFPSAEVRLELKRINGRMTEVTRSVLGQGSRATTRETVNTAYATLVGEVRRTVQFSAKTVRGASIELCRVNGESLVAEVVVPNTVPPASTALPTPVPMRAETTDSGHALLAPVVGDGLSAKEFRAAITLAKPRHVALMTLSLESPEGKGEHPGLGYYAAALDQSVPFATLASWTADTRADGLVSFQLKVSGQEGKWIDSSGPVDWLRDYEWTATRPDRSHWVGPGAWNLNDTNSLVIFEGVKRGRPEQRATVRLNFSVFRLPEGFQPTKTGRVVQAGASWRTDLGMPADTAFPVTPLVLAGSTRASTPEHLGTTVHPDGSSTATYRVPTAMLGVPWFTLLVGLFVLGLLAVGLWIIVRKRGGARAAGCLLVGVLLLVVLALVLIGYRKVARDFGPGAVLAPVASGPRVELTALSPQAPPTLPGGRIMLVQSGYRVSVPPGMVVTFQAYERQWDDSWQSIPALSAFIATGDKATYSRQVYFTLTRGDGQGTNQLWNWRVSALDADGVELPHRVDHETNRLFHVPTREFIASDELNWSRLAIPAALWLEQGQQRNITMFRTTGAATARGRYPKEIEVRIRCERASQLTLQPSDRRVDLGLRAHTVLSWMLPALDSGGVNGPAAIAKAREAGVAAALEDIRNGEPVIAGVPGQTSLQATNDPETGLLIFWSPVGAPPGFVEAYNDTVRDWVREQRRRAPGVAAPGANSMAPATRPSGNAAKFTPRDLEVKNGRTLEVVFEVTHPGGPPWVGAGYTLPEGGEALTRMHYQGQPTAGNKWRLHTEWDFKNGFNEAHAREALRQLQTNWRGREGELPRTGRVEVFSVTNDAGRVMHGFLRYDWRKPAGPIVTAAVKKGLRFPGTVMLGVVELLILGGGIGLVLWLVLRGRSSGAGRILAILVGVAVLLFALIVGSVMMWTKARNMEASPAAAVGKPEVLLAPQREAQLPSSAAKPQDVSAPPAARTFALRHKLGSEMAEELRRMVVAERLGYSVTNSADNQSVIISAPADVLARAQTFITVTDWPEPFQSGVGPTYLQDTVLRSARSLFHACAVEASPQMLSDLLSLHVLAELKGEGRTERYFHYQTGGVPDPAWEKELRGDWPGKEAALRRFAEEWTRYPLKRLTERAGVAMGFGVKHFCSVSFEGAPEEFYEITIEPDRVDRNGGQPVVYRFSSLPPWWERRKPELEVNQDGRQPFMQGVASPKEAEAGQFHPVPTTRETSHQFSAGQPNWTVVGGASLLFVLLGGGVVFGIVMLFRKGTNGARVVAVLLVVALVLLALLIAVMVGFYWVRGRNVAAHQQAQDRAVREVEAIRAEHERQAGTRAPLAVLGGVEAAKIPTHIDFKLVRVENPPGTRNIRLEFERDANYGLALEVSQDVTPAGTNFPKSGFVGWRQKTWLGANDGRVIVWTLPDEFTLPEAARVVREIEKRVKTWGPLPDGAVPEFATVTHRDGWKYHLLARVLREPGSAHPIAPAGASLTAERVFHLPGDSLVRVRLQQAGKDGRKSALGEPLVFKTAVNRATGFIVRWRAYPPQQGKFGNRWLLDLVDPDTGVTFHRVDNAFALPVNITSPDITPLPGKSEPVTLSEPGRSAPWQLLRAEQSVAPGAAVSAWWEVFAEVESVRVTNERPVPAFQMPAVTPLELPLPSPAEAH